MQAMLVFNAEQLTLQKTDQLDQIIENIERTLARLQPSLYTSI